MSAPWIYRRRFAVFGLVYGLSFFVGYLIAGLAGIAVVPAYRAWGDPVVLGSVAVACALCGFALRVWASSYLTSTIVWQGDPQSRELRVSGPYRFTRNPLYLGNILQAMAIGLIFPWTVFVVLTCAMVVYSYVLIGIEERFLTTMQGDAYERYKRSVGRLVPRPWRVAPGGSQPASLREGLRAESTIGIISFVVFIVVFAIRR